MPPISFPSSLLQAPTKTEMYYSKVESILKINSHTEIKWSRQESNRRKPPSPAKFNLRGPLQMGFVHSRMVG